jgi:hypothetical protein
MRRNWGIAVAALMLAAFFWLQINLNTEQRINVSIPIAITSSPSSLIPISIEPESIEVIIEGKGRNILRARVKRLVYHIDLKDAHFGKNFYPFDIANIKEELKNYNIRITPEFNIENIVITMDNLGSKTVPVSITFADEQSREYFITQKFLIEPEIITVKGPKTLFDSINEVKTVPFNRKRHEGNDKLALVMPEVKYINLEPRMVSLVPLSSQIIQRTITMIPIQVPQGVQVFPKYLTVKVTGEEELVIDIAPEDFSAVLTIPDNVKEGDMAKVTVSVPEGIEITEQTPQQVRIKELP